MHYIIPPIPNPTVAVVLPRITHDILITNTWRNGCCDIIFLFFSCDQADLWMLCSVRLSICHTFLPLSPPGCRGIVVTVRAAGQLPNLSNPYLCNRFTGFLHWKFCGIVLACRCALSWSFGHLPHVGLPMGQKLVKFATNWVDTLRNTYLWNCWMDLPHLKFHGLV